MLEIKISFTTEELEKVIFIAYAEKIESGSIPNSHRFKLLDEYNNFSEENLKIMKFYIKSSFFSSGTLYVNDEPYLGILSLSIETKILGIILGRGENYHSSQEADFILDLRKK